MINILINKMLSVSSVQTSAIGRCPLQMMFNTIVFDGYQLPSAKFSLPHAPCFAPKCSNQPYILIVLSLKYILVYQQAKSMMVNTKIFKMVAAVTAEISIGISLCCKKDINLHFTLSAWKAQSRSEDLFVNGGDIVKGTSTGRANKRPGKSPPSKANKGHDQIIEGLCSNPIEGSPFLTILSAFSASDISKMLIFVLMMIHYFTSTSRWSDWWITRKCVC